MVQKFSIVVLFLTIIKSCITLNFELENYKPDKTVNSDDFFDFGTLRLSKIARNKFSISGEFELLENCGNEKKWTVQFRKRAEHQPFMKMEGPFCDVLKKDKFFYEDVQKKSNLPEGHPCPFPKGKYFLKDYVVDDKKFAMITPGEYTARIAASENDVVLAAVDVDCTVTL